MKKKRLWSFAAMLLLLFTGQAATPKPAYACVCIGPSSTQLARDGAYAVFLGKVVEIEEQPYTSPQGSETYMLQSAVFEVTSVWKGSVGQKAKVSSILVTGCDFYFATHETYVVFAQRFEFTPATLESSYPTNQSESAERLSARQCSGTAPLDIEQGQQALKDLGPGEAPEPFLEPNIPVTAYAEVGSKQATQEQETDRNNMNLVLSVLGTFLLILLIGLIFVLFKRRSNANEQV